MKTVNIYLENGGKSPKPCAGWYGYILEYQGQRLYTRKRFARVEGTRQERDLVMLLDAMERCKPCRIRQEDTKGCRITQMQNGSPPEGIR